MFETEVVPQKRDECLADQLVAWGNIFLGAPPPDNFYEVMEAASEITGTFTSTECSDADDRILTQRKSKVHQIQSSVVGIFGFHLARCRDASTGSPILQGGG